MQEMLEFDYTSPTQPSLRSMMMSPLGVSQVRLLRTARCATSVTIVWRHVVMVAEPCYQ
jgi:hypothetical protein